MTEIMSRESEGDPDNEALSSLLLLLKSNNGSKQRQNPTEPKQSNISDENETRSAKLEAVKDFTISDLRPYFHLPIAEAARQLHICATLLKKICRKCNINRWPYRQIRSIMKNIQSLEIAAQNDTLHEIEKGRFREQIATLQKTLNLLIEDPNTPVVGQTMMPGGMIDADDLEGLVEGLAARRPMVASILASQPLRDFHISSSSEQRKRKVPDTEPTSNEDEASAISIIGETVAPYTTLTNHTGSGICFLGNVQLAPLVRRKTKAQKKLVPLIEPDICNYIEMDFLPQTILRLSGYVPYVHPPTKPSTHTHMTTSDTQEPQPQAETTSTTI